MRTNSSPTITFVLAFMLAFMLAFVITLTTLSTPPYTQVVQRISSSIPFTPITSIIKSFQNEPYTTTPLVIKLRYQQDGVVFMDYVTNDNFLMVIIRSGKPVVRFAHEGDLHVVTLTATPTLVLSIMKDPSVNNQVQVQGYNYITKKVETKTIQTPFKRLTSHQIRIGNSAPISIRHGELSKSFTGDLYWIRYVDNYVASELV